MAAFDQALQAVRTYLVESADRERWDDRLTTELSEVIRSCVESICIHRRDSQAAVRLPLDVIHLAVGYVDEHLTAAGSE